jgi:nitrite reductase (cytochrome c-552)
MRRRALVAGLFVLAAAAAFGVAGLLLNIFERKQEARLYPAKLVDIAPDEPDSSRWGQNFPHQHDRWRLTETTAGRTKYGGSEAYQRLDTNPRLKRLFAGYPFAVDYREERGHHWAVHDVRATLRTVQFDQPLTCMTCKSSQVPGAMRAMGVAEFYRAPFKAEAPRFTHPIGCADCHDAQTMALRISRPAFREAMERRGVDLARATRQELRSYVCGQCHAEYYFVGDGKYLTFPWTKGLRADQIEQHYAEAGFTDWTHAETKGRLVKLQHPEFELWSTGIHARSGVSCADCHMPYLRIGAVKISDHWLRSPLGALAPACQNCHRWAEEELKARVETVQDRTAALMERAERALVDAIEAIRTALAAGATDRQVEAARALHRRGQLRWDFASAENSMGFHSPGEAARLLGEAIDFARQAQLAAAALAAGRR